MTTRLLTLGLVAALLASCSNDALQTSRAKLNVNNAAIAEAAQRAQLRAAQTGRLVSSTEMFLGDEVIDLDKGSPLPERTGVIDLALREALPLSSIAKALSEQAGYPIVSVMNDAPRAIGRLQGDLGTVLAKLKTTENIGYEHRNGVVMLIPAGVEIVPIPAVLVPALQPLGSSSSNRRGSGGGGQQSATAQQGANKGVNSEDGLKKFLQQLSGLSADLPYPGTTIKADEILGVVTIKGPPAALPAVKRLVEERIALIKQPVRVDLRVLSLDVGTRRELSTNLDSVWGSLFGQPARLIGNSTATSLSLLRNTPVGIKPDTLEAAISTLASRNNVLSNQRITATLMPGTIKAVSDVRVRTYIRESTPPGQSSSTTLTSTTATVTQDDIETGTRGQIVAVPVSKSQIDVGYTLAISSLLALRQITSGNVTLQQPETLFREFADRVVMTSGDTIVVSSQLIETASSTGAGVINADLPVPGNASGETNLQLLIVLLSAEMVNPASPVRDPANGNILRVAGGAE
jgi:hypothetical protein